ncbi:MAG: toprim domain-containing protein [Lactobacillus sp.]|nr:toprim domain-containing protein [Lactobacillus sp.]
MAKIKYDEVKNELKSKLPDYLSELGINADKPFNCENPSHDDKNPSMVLNKKNGSTSVHCFGCGVSWDIFDLYAVETEQGTVNSDGTVTYDFKKIMNELAKKYGINLPDYKPSQEDLLDQKVGEMAQYTIKVAQAHLDETDYLKKRGISMELAKRFHLGYVPTWGNPKPALEGKKIQQTPRIIIPTSAKTYLARDTRSNIPDEEKPYKKTKVGKAHLFNGKALLQDTKPIFLVEGEFDALSIMEASDKVEAVALGSTQNQRILKDALDRVKHYKANANMPYDPLILIAMDNDDAGDMANHQIDQLLKGMHFVGHIVTHALVDYHKDANEALVADKARLTSNIEKILKEPDQYLDNLMKRIEQNLNKQLFIPTGFSNLDKVLDGGLYPQLYIIGAVSSLGKTTFTLQIADSIARQKRPVFFFSLETSKDTLTEKNISKITFETAGDDSSLPQTARSIDNGYFLEIGKDGFKHPKVMKHVTNAFSMYKEYYQNLMINNGITNRPSAQDIYNQVQTYCVRHPDLHPVVIVDYLQILKPMRDNMTDKEAVTSSVAKLNELTEKFHAPVILISSFNRQNYDSPVSMQSFKESGEIEYYSDVLMGLQYQDGQKPDFEDTDPMTSRKIEAVILKNRNGVSRSKVGFDFYSAFNEFIPEISN